MQPFVVRFFIYGIFVITSLKQMVVSTKHDRYRVCFALVSNIYTLHEKGLAQPTYSSAGGRRYHMMKYQDAMAICRAYVPPGLLVTFTCNTKWGEIVDALMS